jgi:hypothetical protein
VAKQQCCLDETYLELNIFNKKGKWVGSRSVKAIRCNTKWVWVQDHAGEPEAIGKYNFNTGQRTGAPVLGKYIYRLVPEEVRPLKPFDKLAYIKRNKPIRPAPVKVVRTKKPKPVKHHWRVILASGKSRVIVGASVREVVEKATRISRGKPPQKVVSKVQKSGFRVDFRGPAEVGKIDNLSQ